MRSLLRRCHRIAPRNVAFPESMQLVCPANSSPIACSTPQVRGYEMYLFESQRSRNDSGFGERLEGQNQLRISCSGACHFPCCGASREPGYTPPHYHARAILCVASFLEQLYCLLLSLGACIPRYIAWLCRRSLGFETDSRRATHRKIAGPELVQRRLQRRNSIRTVSERAVCLPLPYPELSRYPS